MQEQAAVVKVNVNGDQLNGAAGNQVAGTDLTYEGGHIYVSANASSGLQAIGGGRITLGKGESIYVVAEDGYASGMSSGWGNQNETVNKGNIYVKGLVGQENQAKGMSVDDGFALNQGHIYVWDAYGMSSNTQGNANANRLKNDGTIEVNGGAGIADSNRNKTTEKVILTNQGTINVNKGDGIKVDKVWPWDENPDSETVIHNQGTITAADGANAVNVDTSTHAVNVRLETGSQIDGVIKIAGVTSNKTKFTVDNAGEQQVEFDAAYLNELEVIGSSLSITNRQDKLTIDGMNLTDGSTFAVAEEEDNLTLVINDLTKDDSSTIDLSNANVDMHQNWKVDIGETEQYRDLFVGDDSAETQTSFTNAGILYVQGDLGVGNNDEFTNIGSESTYPLGGIATAQSLTLTSGSSFNNSGRVDISGTATVEAGAKFNNTYNGKAGTFFANGLVSEATVTNAGSFTIRGESQINAGTFRNDNNAVFNGLTTIAQGATVYNNGSMTLSGVAGSASADDVAAQIINAVGKTMTFTSGADIGAKVSNSGKLILNDGAILTDTVTNHKNGTLSSTNLTVQGKLDNQSNASHHGTVTLNGKMVNSGVEDGKDATLVIGTGSNTPTYTNDGSASWSQVDIASGVWTNNLGAEFVAGTLNVGTEKTNSWTMLVAGNNGTLNAGEINVQKALLSNGSEAGVISAGAISVSANGELSNHNTINVAGTISLSDAGKLSNADVASIKATGLVIDGGSLENQGMIDVNGLQMWNADFRNTGTLSITSDFSLHEGAVTNQGVLNAGSANTQLFAGTSLTNESEMSLGAVTFNGNTRIVNTADATLKLNGNLDAVEGALSAALENAGTAELGTIAINGITFRNTGKLIGNGDVTLGSTLVNRGEADFTGRLTLEDGSYLLNQGTAKVAMFLFKDGAAITNSGKITGTAASSSFNNVTYEEVGAAAELDVGDIAFYNSTIKLTDGAVWNKNGSSLGVGNDYVLGSNFAKEDFGSTLLRDWRDGFSILEADEVNGINSFVLNKGGLLVADKLGSFSGTGYDGKITFNGGALETGLDQVFDNVAYVDGITGSVITDSSVVGDLIAANTIGDVTENAQNAFVVGEEGGHIVFNDNYISTDLVAAVSNAFEAQEGWDNLTAHYTGELDPTIFTNVNWANSLTNQIDSSVVLGKVSLIAQQPVADNGMFDMVDGKLVMNAANAQGTTELGVGNIVNTENVVIENGAHLTLVGFGQGESMVGDNGTVTVDGSDSLLTLGWNAGKLTGIVAENGGRVEITNGSYTVGSITGDGSVLNQGYLEAGNLQAQQFVNVGGAYVTGNVNVGNFANNAGLVVVDGTLTATEGLSNDAGAELAVDALKGLELRNNGSVLVAGDATIDGELSNGLLEGADGAAVQIDGDLTAALIRNAAALQVDKTANVAKIENEAGSIQLGSLISNEVINKGTLIVKKDQGLSEIREALSNAEKASFLVNHDLKAGTIDNDGVLRVDGALTAETLDNASGANVVAGNADVDGIENFGNLGVEGYIKADTLSNHGAMSAGSLEVSANFTNAGTAGVVEDASVAGKLTNTSEGDLIVGGKLSADEINNDGTLMAGSLDVTMYTNAGDAGVGGDATVGTLMNTGDLTVSGNAVVNGVGDNKKTMIVAQKLTANDVFFNHDGAELTVGGDADFNGVFANQGTAVINGAATVAQGVNAGEATLAVNGDLTVEESLDNQNVLTVFGALDVDGNLDNSGKTFVDGALTVAGTLTQTAGEFLAIGGESGNVVSGAVDVKGGKFTLGETTTTAGAVMTATNGSTVQMVAADDKLAGRINVDGATFTLGNDLPETLSNVDKPQHEVSSLFNMNQQAVDLGADGIIAVGDGAENVELTGGSVWFGSGSLLALNTSTYNGDSGFFKGQGSFKVEDGAQIQVSDASIGWGTYTLVSEGFGDVELAEGGWLEHENIIYTGEKDIDLTIRENEDGNVEITVGSNNILDKLPDVAIPNLVNEVISDPHRSPNDSGVKGFLAGAIENGILSENLQAETINNTAQIMASGGVLVQGMTLVGNVMDITDRHLSYEDVHFKNGQLQRFDGVRLWADALGQRVDASGYDFSGSSAEFDGYNSGFIFGADLMASCDARYGAAFAYQNANVDSNGSIVKTSNEADAYTFALYGAKTYGNFNFIGSFAYTRIDSDLEQSLPGALGAKQGKHKLDVSNDIFTLGLKGEYKVSLSQNTQMVPYVGVRAVWMDTSDETSKLGGSDAFDYETDSVTQVQFPIGVAFQGTTETKSGWIGRGVFDLSVTPVAGDKDSDTTITANGLTAQDVVNTEFADDLTGAVRIGISAEKDDMSFGGNLGFSTGGSRDGNVTFGLNARYRF